MVVCHFPQATGRRGTSLSGDVCKLFLIYYGSRIRDQGLGSRDQGSGIKEQGAGIRVQGSGIREQGSGIKVQGSGIREQETVNCEL